MEHAWNKLLLKKCDDYFAQFGGEADELRDVLYNMKIATVSSSDFPAYRCTNIYQAWDTLCPDRKIIQYWAQSEVKRSTSLLEGYSRLDASCL